MGSMTTATAPSHARRSRAAAPRTRGAGCPPTRGPVDGHRALVVQRKRALVVQRTGWGKSAVYFISAKLLRATGHGPPTVIVSPLLA